MSDRIDHFYHGLSGGPKVNVKISRNSRGVNWEVTIIGAEDVKEAMKLIDEAEDLLHQRYGQGEIS